MFIVIFVLAGYALALPFVAWCRRDLASFRRPVWAGYGRPHFWRRSLRFGYACLGWPAIFVAAGWRLSQTRAQLVVTRAQMRSARDSRVVPQNA